MIDQVNQLSAPPSSTSASASTSAHVGLGSSTLAPSSTSATAPQPSDAKAADLPDDPIHQLTAILGAHLRALSSIDGSAGRLEGQVDELERAAGVGGGKGRW